MVWSWCTPDQNTTQFVLVEQGIDYETVWADRHAITSFYLSGFDAVGRDAFCPAHWRNCLLMPIAIARYQYLQQLLKAQALLLTCYRSVLNSLAFDFWLLVNSVSLLRGWRPGILIWYGRSIFETHSKITERCNIEYKVMIFCWSRCPYNYGR